MRFSYGRNAIPMAEWAEMIFQGILFKCELNGILITSTKRTPADQARIMYENLNGPLPDKKTYIDRQLRLYGDNGDLVIRIFEQQLAMGATAEAVIHAMENKIIELGPQKVSAHCVEDPDREVFDVAPSSVPEAKRELFKGVIKNTPGVTKLIPYPLDPAYHIEMIKFT